MLTLPLTEDTILTQKEPTTMSTMTIKNKKHKLELTVEYNFPTTVADAVTMFGEEVVFSRVNRQLQQELRASVIRQVETALGKKGAKKSDAQAVATAAAAGFKPDVRSGTGRAVKTIDKALAGLSDEERAMVLAALLPSAGPNGGGIIDALASV